MWGISGNGLDINMLCRALYICNYALSASFIQSVVFLPDGDERVLDGLAHRVGLGLRHAPQISHFLPEVLRLLLQTPQLVVHLRREREVPVHVLAGHQRGRLRRWCRLVPVSLWNPFIRRIRPLVVRVVIRELREHLRDLSSHGRRSFTRAKSGPRIRGGERPEDVKRGVVPRVLVASLREWHGEHSVEQLIIRFISFNFQFPCINRDGRIFVLFRFFL